MKIALDKIGIDKNKREYKEIKSKNNSINVEFKGVGERILIVEAINQQIYRDIIYDYGEIKIIKLNDESEFNYDGLFGGNALDYNNFTGLTVGVRSFELDISNSFDMNLTKKIRCEELKQEIIPTYMYNVTTGNYHYECDNILENGVPYKSNPMNYVEFKYFLRDNGIIKF